MCRRLNEGFKEAFKRLFGPKNELEDYIKGSTSIAEIERRQQEWHFDLHNYR